MRKFLISCTLLFSMFAFAQVKQHNVQPKETIYGISKQYGISQQALKNANPFLNNRALQVGDVLTIPSTQKTSSEITLPQVVDYEDANFYYRVVKPKETVYRLSKTYNVTQEALKSLNPFIAERGLQVGDVIRIAKNKNERKAVQQPTPEGMYEVKAGDTVYSIAKENGIAPADVYAANKSVQVEGLKEGTFIKIPKTKSVTIERNWFKHKVEKGETIFALLRKYNVSLDELLKNNPNLSNGLIEGMVISVPMEKGAKVNDEVIEEKTMLAASVDNEINIALVLPFYIDQPSAYRGERKVAQEFYMGVQVALNDLIKQGKKINLKVVDGRNEKSVLKNLLTSIEANKYDAMIGPFFQDMVEYAAEQSLNKQMPIFSPVINSQKLEKYANVYLANPRDEYAADILVEDIIEKYKGQTIKILTTVDERPQAVYLSDALTKKLKNANISIVYNADDLKLLEQAQTQQLADGTVQEFVTYQPEIAVLVSENNTLGDRFVNVITQQEPQYITGFSQYFVPAFDIFDGRNKKNIEALKKIGFEFTATRMINSYGSNEKKILQAFENKYCQKPTKYMAMGYDLMFDVVDRMDKSGYLSEAAMQESKTRLSSKFGYQTAEKGKAKVNKEIRVIKLN